MADFITLEEYKDYKGKSNPKDDNQINVTIPLVSNYIKEYCKRTFIDYYGSPGGSPRKTEYFDSNIDVVYVSEFPIKEGSPAVTVEYSEDNGVTYTALVEGTDFFIDYVEGTISTGDGTVFYATAKPFRSLKVVYNGGEATTPLDIKLASYLLVDFFMDKLYIENKVINSNTMQTFDSNKLPFHIRGLLERHRELI
jgi:hypothetical protein